MPSSVSLRRNSDGKKLTPQEGTIVSNKPINTSRMLSKSITQIDTLNDRTSRRGGDPTSTLTIDGCSKVTCTLTLATFFMLGLVLPSLYFHFNTGAFVEASLGMVVTDHECLVRSFVNNGICEDFANIEACLYDGGDCCRAGSLMTRCKKCQCIGYSFTDDDLLASSCKVPEIIGNGICEDKANTEECRFDGSDCCLAEIDDRTCQTCVCHTDGHRHRSKFEIKCHKPHLVGDGFCQDEANVLACNFDGLDCCLPVIKDADCSDCTCHLTGLRSPPMCPRKLENCMEHILKIAGKGMENPLAFSTVTSVIGNGVCNRFYNVDVCLFDGGDCCRPSASFKEDDLCAMANYYCLNMSKSGECLDCVCHKDGVRRNAKSAQGCSRTSGKKFIGDRTCDDWLNFEDCDYDGNDCCQPLRATSRFAPLLQVSYHYLENIVEEQVTCRECKCHLTGSSSPANSSRELAKIEVFKLLESYKDRTEYLCDNRTRLPDCSPKGSCCTFEMDDHEAEACKACNCRYEENVISVDCSAAAINDGICDDFNNVPECLFDGGDCCRLTDSTAFELCLKCLCHELDMSGFDRLPIFDEKQLSLEEIYYYTHFYLSNTR